MKNQSNNGGFAPQEIVMEFSYGRDSELIGAEAVNFCLYMAATAT